MRVSVEDSAIESVAADAIVVNLFKGVTEPAGATGAVDAALGGAIRDVIRAGDIEGKLGQTVTIYTRGAIPAARVIVVGLGPADEFDLEAVRRAAAKAALAAKGGGTKTLATIAHGAGIGGLDAQAAAQATVEGTMLALYSFRDYKTKGDADPVADALVVCERDADRLPQVKAGAEIGQAVAAGVALARDLGNHPANTATATYYAEQARQLAQRHGMRYEAGDRARILELGMGAFAAVNQGSAEPPRLIIVEHATAGHESDPPLVLVGKALTFDTGGISLKPGAGMGAMKFDMCGGGAVFGALEAIGRLALPVRVVAIVGSTDNMPDGAAVHPGDIVKAMNGKTIEILNTDAEGRLVLADLLSYAATLTPKPAAVVDLATLTGAIVVALGHVAAGLFPNDDALASQLERAAEASGDRVWRFPMWKAYGRTLVGDTADLQNIAEGKAPSPAGSIFGAKFLEEFVDYPWAHLDIAGVAWHSDEIPYNPKGATGFGVRLLVEWIRERAA